MAQPTFFYSILVVSICIICVYLLYRYYAKRDAIDRALTNAKKAFISGNDIQAKSILATAMGYFPQEPSPELLYIDLYEDSPQGVYGQRRVQEAYNDISEFNARDLKILCRILEKSRDTTESQLNSLRRAKIYLLVKKVESAKQVLQNAFQFIR